MASVACMLDADELEELTSTEDSDLALYHMDLGMWMRNEWGLWAGSPLRDYFVGLGVEHPDDMSAIILASLWRRLKGRPTDLDSQVAYYTAYWQAWAEPPAVTCANGEERTYSVARDAGEPPDSLVVTFWAQCGDGEWFEYTSRDRSWRRSDGPVLGK